MIKLSCCTFFYLLLLLSYYVVNQRVLNKYLYLTKYETFDISETKYNSSISVDDGSAKPDDSKRRSISAKPDELSAN